MAEQMKDSGIPIIGKIPISWKLSRVKYWYSINLGKMLQPLQENPQDTLAPYMCAANIKWTGINLDTIKEMWFSPAEKKQYELKNGDLLVAEGGDVAVSCIWENQLPECYIQNAIHRVRQIGNTDNRFLYYWLYFLKHFGYIDLICNKATIAHFTKEKLGEAPLCIMSLLEQKAIADFLDKECAQIDSIAADLKNQIELLQQYKKSLITETVTKGLDKSVPMKDSGIGWIGEIPSNYIIRRLKYMTEIKDGTHDTPPYVEENEDTYPLITSKHITAGNHQIDFSAANHISKEDFWAIYRRSNVKYGDIIMPMIGTIGNPVIVNTDRLFGIKNVALFKTGNDLIEAKYIYYQFYSNILSEQFSLMSRGGVQSFVSLEVLGNLQFIDCDPSEKAKIVRYLDSQCKKINSIIDDKCTQLNEIKSHKKSLVYEYVTGKKRVKEAQ